MARGGAPLVAVSLVSLPFALPHVIEDFEEGIAASVGLTTPALAFLLGAFLALQSLGLVLVARGRRLGSALTLAVGLIWVSGALAEHGLAWLAGPFRSGAPSTVWLAGLILTQAAAAILAAFRLRRPDVDSCP